MEYLAQGPATSKEIQSATGLSQTAVSRQLRSLGSRILKLRRGRSPKYVLTCNAFGSNDRLPLSMVDASGNTVLVTYIRPLAHRGYFVEQTPGTPSLLLGESGAGLYDDLPYFLLDLSPKGFLGRQLAKKMAAQSPDFPPDPQRWNTNQIGRYLLSNGDDLPGNFKLGEMALLRIRRRPVAISDEEYPDLADEVMNGELPGSSAGGEQPKFAVFSQQSSSHVIVKFSPKGENEIARRWRDILITEYHAAEAIRIMRFPVAETRLIEKGQRLFLESRRFDRAGEYGRLSMVSLQAIDAEFVGLASGWPGVLNELYQKKRISQEHFFAGECLWCFGHLINNSDMHLGNLSLAIDGNIFRLLPLYDMCSMGFAPQSGGEITPYNFVPSDPQRIHIPDAAYKSVQKMAFDFWERVAKDERISDEFRMFLKQGNPIGRMKNSTISAK
jgi:hypothetical protein